MVNQQMVRSMAVAWIDGELARLKALRSELVEQAKPDTAAQAKKRAAILARRKKPHWTQRPENRSKVKAMSQRSAATRAAKAGGEA